MKIQKELNETKETLQKAIQSTLERGECVNGRIRTDGARGYLKVGANCIPNSRRETRQPCRKVRQLERLKQNVLHPSEEAELVLRGHVNYWAAEAYELDGFARSICAASGWVKQRLFSPLETLRTFRLIAFELDVTFSSDRWVVQVSKILRVPPMRGRAPCLSLATHQPDVSRCADSRSNDIENGLFYGSIAVLCTRD
jgi:hypothetical protein